MSWWVYLVDEDGWVGVDKHTEGGTYVVGGRDEAALNVTYNYNIHYLQELDSEAGLRWLNGKKARDVTDALAKAVDTLGVEPADDYWEPTAGNAGRALATLLDWAKQYPEAVFRVS